MEAPLTAIPEDFPVDETIEIHETAEVAAAISDACQRDQAIYPIGGGTALGWGLPATRPGTGLLLNGLQRVIDYPARDMTITVEAGITMQTLAAQLAAEGQQLPLDVPQADQATLGGVVATNTNGPRRFGLGTVRDYVIGIHAVDGQGTPFQGGGRVVKNVAGYDFCKLLTGSMGTLGVITQLTLKLKPIPEQRTLVACAVDSWQTAETLLEGLVQSQTAPVAVELISGSTWLSLAGLPTGGHAPHPGSSWLLVALEGTQPEVRWMVDQILQEWRAQSITAAAECTEEQATALWSALVEFPAGESPLVLQASVVPSATTRMMAAFHEVDADCSLQAHAGSGTVIARFSAFPSDGLSRALVAHLQPVAVASQGSITILSNPGKTEMTPQCVWGGNTAPFELMSAVKQKFDPQNLLNPDRFVYRSTAS